MKKLYLDRNPDKAESNNDPMLHFLRYGGFEDAILSPNFSSNWYFDTYEDVKKAEMDPLIHYLTTGMLGDEQ